MSSAICGLFGHRRHRPRLAWTECWCGRYRWLRYEGTDDWFRVPRP